jgi:hypothetical protein
LLERRATALVNAGRVPARLEESLMSGVAALAEQRPICLPKVTAAPTSTSPSPPATPSTGSGGHGPGRDHGHGHGPGHGKGHGDGQGDEG